jgi:hypothetical protein
MIKTTGIGSLPFENVSEAIKFSMQFDIPFLPELPNLQKPESMLKLLFNISPHICLEPFLEAASDTEFKIQLPGPYTYSKCLDMPLGLTINLFKTKFNLLLEKIQGKSFVFFIDEPSIDKDFKLSHEYATFLSEIHRQVPALGVHSCNTFDPDELFSYIDIASIDCSLVIKSEKVNLCAGVVDSVTNEPLVAELPPKTLIITHNCGLLGNDDIDNAYQSLEKFKLKIK